MHLEEQIVSLLLAIRYLFYMHFEEQIVSLLLAIRYQLYMHFEEQIVSVCCPSVLWVQRIPMSNSTPCYTNRNSLTLHRVGRGAVLYSVQYVCIY